MKSILSKIKGICIKALKKSRTPLVILIVLFAVVFSLFRALTPWVDKYKSEFEKQASIKLGQPVTIQSLETSWYWFRPVLKLNDVSVLGANNKNLQLSKLLVGIDLWSSLWSWQIKPGILYLGDVNLVVRQMHDHWEIDGLKYDKQTMSIDNNSYLAILGWLLSQESVIVKRFMAQVYFADGKTISLKEFNFKSVNSNGNYKIYGNAKLDQTNPTSVSVIAQLQIDANEMSKINGSVYLALENFAPAQWSRFLPKLSYKLTKGLCNLDAWFELKDSTLSGLQTTIDFKNVSLLETATLKHHQVEYLKANMAWRKSKSGWKIFADKVKLSLDGVKWPENRFSLAYFEEEKAYNVFAQAILLDSLFTADIHWPSVMTPVLKLHPTGELHDTQMHIKDGTINYFLARFSNLGWQGKKNIPAVKQISGVLYWEPAEGRLVLDGEKTTVAALNYSPLTFDVLNADIYWKKLNNGFRIDLDRFVLSSANLVFSANGVLDDFNQPNSNLRLEAEFSAKNAHNLLEYIPSGHLKPKFEAWLKHDVKRIDHVSGRMIVKGHLEDFPFDNRPGKFLIKSHASGVDLAINPDWPLNRDIDADLEFNKRSFTANVDQANLQNLLISKFNLAVNNIGSGTESLLIHGEIEAPGEQIKNYIYATPLKNKLSRWKNIDINDQFWIDLNLDIPLYPENDHVVALGEMVFSENPVVFNFQDVDVRVGDVTGSLKFNEYGLTDGSLKGLLDGSPISLKARSMIAPKERTEITIDGEAGIDYLQKIIKSPALALFYGHFNASALWTIYPDVNDFDTLHINTNLEGVSIAFPEPLKKEEQTSAPLTADIAFVGKNKIDVHLNYNNVLDGKLLFASPKNALVFSKGELLLGDKMATLPKQSGLRMTGLMDKLDIAKWHDALSKLPKGRTSFSVIDVLSSVDMNISNLILVGKSYNNLAFKAQKKAKNDWSLAFNQSDFVADLHYNTDLNTITGNINNLSITTQSNNKTNGFKWKLEPIDIPNMELNIKTLKVQDIDIGSLDFKSTSSKTVWTLDSLDIKSPNYHFKAEAKWESIDNKDKTFVNANLRLDDLCKSLERFHITPVVHSNHGNVSFDGEWNGAVYDFSIKNLAGNMLVTLKNGRISNFDKEVEEKLGLGRLLSILSLQTIPRRLKLDFSDLSQDGYSFDIFKGSFLLDKGVMATTDSYIDGPVAYAKMTGNLDLNKQLYDINLRITPYITASLPVVATIAGGPIAGFATWVASSIINKGMQNISGYTYKVSGPWHDPVVQQVKLYKKRARSN